MKVRSYIKAVTSSAVTCALLSALGCYCRGYNQKKEILYIKPAKPQYLQMKLTPTLMSYRAAHTFFMSAILYIVLIKSSLFS